MLAVIVVLRSSRSMLWTEHLFCGGSGRDGMGISGSGSSDIGVTVSDTDAIAWRSCKEGAPEVMLFDGTGWLEVATPVFRLWVSGFDIFEFEI